MRFEGKVIAAAALLAMTASLVVAGEKVGYNKVELPAGSDVVLTVPFSQDSEVTYTVDSNDASSVKPTVATPGTYGGGTYYVRFIDGGAEGLWSTITVDDGTRLTLETTGVLPYVSAGDTFRVYKHHTINSLFSSRTFGLSHNAQSEIVLFKNDPTDTRRPKTSIGAVAYLGGAWRGGPGGAGGNNILKPETMFIFRNKSADDLTLMSHGDAPDYHVSLLLIGGDDMAVGSGYPLAVPLTLAGLGGTQRTFVKYDNSVPQSPRTPSGSFAWAGTSWVPGSLASSYMLMPSGAFILQVPTFDDGVKVTITGKPY